jgi:hypothetical protein
MVESRRTRRIRKIIANMRAARDPLCRRCGLATIDYDAKVGEPNAFNAGHIKSWDDYPELREDPANYQPEHERCNKGAGKTEQISTTGMSSRRWGKQ